MRDASLKMLDLASPRPLVSEFSAVLVPLHPISQSSTVHMYISYWISFRDCTCTGQCTVVRLICRENTNSLAL